MRRFSGGVEPKGGFAEALVAAMPGTVMVVDEMGRILFIGADRNKLLGQDLDYWIGQSSLDMVHPDDLPSTISRLQGPSDHGPHPERQMVRTRIGSADQWHTVELDGFRPIDFDGTTAVVVSVHDVDGQLSIDEARRFGDRSLTSDGANRIASAEDELISRAMQFFQGDSQVLLMHVCMTNFFAVEQETGSKQASQVLTDVATNIIAHSRRNDLVARVADDALLFLCLAVESTDASKLAARVFALCEQGAGMAQRQTPCKFTVGFALASEGDDLAEVRAFASTARQFSSEPS